MGNCYIRRMLLPGFAVDLHGGRVQQLNSHFRGLSHSVWLAQSHLVQKFLRIIFHRLESTQSGDFSLSHVRSLVVVFSAQLGEGEGVRPHPLSLYLPLHSIHVVPFPARLASYRYPLISGFPYRSSPLLSGFPYRPSPLLSGSHILLSGFQYRPSPFSLVNSFYFGNSISIIYW
jgi:hypothetical protein